MGLLRVEHDQVAGADHVRVSLPGCQVLNDVVLNQVVFRFADDETTDRILRRVVDGGEAWMSGTTVDGRRAIRLSVCNWQTSDGDITRTLEAFRNASGC